MNLICSTVDNLFHQELTQMLLEKFNYAQHDVGSSMEWRIVRDINLSSKHKYILDFAEIQFEYLLSTTQIWRVHIDLQIESTRSK